MNEINMITHNIFTREQLEKACGEFFNPAQKVHFDIGDVPENLLSLIPYAEIWGLSDDWEREDLIQKTPEIMKENLKWAVTQFEDEMDTWLGGAEALSDDPSDAYIAFSAFRMAVDFI